MPQTVGKIKYLLIFFFAFVRSLFLCAHKKKVGVK